LPRRQSAGEQPSQRGRRPAEPRRRQQATFGDTEHPAQRSGSSFRLRIDGRAGLRCRRQVLISVACRSLGPNPHRAAMRAARRVDSAPLSVAPHADVSARPASSGATPYVQGPLVGEEGELMSAFPRHCDRCGRTRHSGRKLPAVNAQGLLRTGGNKVVRAVRPTTTLVARATGA
jgi:hypothetical protein